MTTLSPERTCIRQGARHPFLRLVPGGAAAGCGCAGDAWDPTAYESYQLTLSGPVNLAGALVYDETERALIYEWPAGSTDIPGTYGVIVSATHIESGALAIWPCDGWAELEVNPLPG